MPAPPLAQPDLDDKFILLLAAFRSMFSCQKIYTLDSDLGYNLFSIF